MHTSFLELWGVKDNSELITLVSDNSKTYATKLQAIVGDLTEEAKKNSGAFDNVIAEVKTKVTDTIRDIEAKNPELMADSKKYQEQFETQMRSLMTETEKARVKLQEVATGEAAQNLNKVFKDLYETTVNTATTYSKQVENTLKQTN